MIYTNDINELCEKNNALKLVFLPLLPLLPQKYTQFEKKHVTHIRNKCKSVQMNFQRFSSEGSSLVKWSAIFGCVLMPTHHGCEQFGKLQYLASSSELILASSELFNKLLLSISQVGPILLSLGVKNHPSMMMFLLKVSKDGEDFLWTSSEARPGEMTSWILAQKCWLFQTQQSNLVPAREW